MVNPLRKSLDLFGNAMKKTSMAFQFRSALAAYFLIWLSTIFLFGFQIYSMFHVFSWWNVFYALNAFCGIFIIYSMLVTTYMSYLQIKAVEEIAEKLDNPDEQKLEKLNKIIKDEKQKIKEIKQAVKEEDEQDKEFTLYNMKGGLE